MPRTEDLSQARAGGNDEFYTQLVDIEREINAYLAFDPDVFRGKTVFLPCDDPKWSNFTKYFAQNFSALGLKKLVSTGYAVRRKRDLGLLPGFGDAPNAGDESLEHGTIFTLDRDTNGNGVIDIDDLVGRPMEGDGDFRSAEVRALRDEADIIVTNPPFSLFREFLAWILEGRNYHTDWFGPNGPHENDSANAVRREPIRVINKKFLIIGNVNAITYKEVFPLIQGNQMWMGESIHSGDREFGVPDHYPLRAAGCRVDADGKKYIRVKGVRWFTNLDHGQRHEPLQCMTMADNLRFNRHKDFRAAGYVRYDNYDAIEVPYTDAIPSDYDGVMGVPITFLDKYCPDQFEIVGNEYSLNIPGGRCYANGVRLYSRILIRKRKDSIG